MSDTRLQADAYFAILPEWVLFHPDLSDRSIRIYGFLARRAGESGQAMPGRKWLADQASCSLSSVDRSVDELEAAGAICRRRVKTPAGDFDRTVYTVHTTRCTGCDGTEKVAAGVKRPSSPVTGGSRTGDATGSRTGDEGVAARVTHLRESPYIQRREPSLRSGSVAGPDFDDDGTPSKAYRDAVWDCLVDLFGKPPPSQESLYGRVVAYLVDDLATVGEIRRRTAALKLEWSNRGESRRFSVAALEKWWSSFDGQVGQTTAADVERARGKLTQEELVAEIDRLMPDPPAIESGGGS